MRLVFLYAGQGSQTPGMGRDLYEQYPAVRPYFDHKPLGLDLKELCFEADAQRLAQTQYTQPCMGAFAAAVTHLLTEAGIRPAMAAGLSLGEYGALHAAGALNAADLIELLAFRGRAMAEAARGIDCAMTAVLGLEEAQATAAVQQAGGQVWCCNFNCPGQIVIGGVAADVAAAAELCRSMGARRCIPLAVSGPFHTPLMAPAAEQLARRLAQQSMGPLSIPVSFNATGRGLEPGESIPALLERQIQSPVRFESNVRHLLEQGAEAFVEIGPGSTLAGFVRKVNPQVRVWSVENAASLGKAIEEIREAIQ